MPGGSRAGTLGKRPSSDPQPAGKLPGAHFRCPCGGILIPELQECDPRTQFVSNVSAPGVAGESSRVAGDWLAIAGRPAILSYLSARLILELESAVPVGRF